MRSTFPKYFLPAILLMACFITAKAQDRYLHLKGNIDNEEAVTADFVIFGSKITGTVQNHFSAGAPVFLHGVISPEGLLELRDKTSDKIVISGSLSESEVLFGKWHHDDEESPFEMSPQLPEGSRPFDVIAVSSIQPLTAQPGSPLASYESTFLSLPGNKYGILRDQLTGLVFRELFRSEPAGEPVAMLKNNESAFFSQYQTSNAGIDIEDNYRFLNWEKSRLLTVVYNGNNVISLYMRDYAYTGGDSGLEMGRFLVFDALEGKKVSFTDIFMPEASASLAALLRNAVCSKTGIDPTADLTGYGYFSNEIPAPQHFALTAYGILCHYNIYEIAGPETGAINIFLPYRQLQPLLNPLHPVLARLK